MMKSNEGGQTVNDNEDISYANLAFGSGEFVKSLEYAEKAINVKPDEVQGYIGLAEKQLSGPGF